MHPRSQISLFDHQNNVVEYMFRIQPEQKGLLVAHYMGTGKSITALCFLMQYHKTDTSKRLTIVHPTGLRQVWDGETKALGVSSLLKQIDFFSHDAYIDYCLNRKGVDQSNRVVVFDEAHILVNNLTEQRVDKTKRILDALKSIHRILCLTGTPVYKDEYDLAWLVNICSGKGVVPVFRKEFDRRFKVLNPRKYGIVARLKAYLRIGKGWVDDQITDVLKPLSSYHVFRPLYQVTKIMFYWNLVFDPKQIAQDNKDMINVFTKKRIMNTVLAYLLVYATNQVVKHMIKTGSQSEYVLDVKKFMNVAGSYISIFEIDDVSKDKASHYASVSTTYATFEYTLGQMQMFISMNIPSTGPDVYMKLMPEGYTLEDAAILGDKTASEDMWGNFYMDRGRIIGNLDENGVDSNKFTSIFKKMKAVAFKRIVVWSNFWERGSMLFGAFLKKNKVTFEYIKPGIKQPALAECMRKFLSGDVSVLILHPDMTEGLSIFGAKQLHILEPVFLLSKLDQIIARVRRYDSHKMVPINERHVSVYVWCATVSGFISSNMRKMIEMKEWATKFALTHTVGKVPEDNNYNLWAGTPDECTRDASWRVDELVEVVKSEGVAFTIDATVKQTKEKDRKACCLWKPKESNVDRCLELHHRLCS